MNNESENINPSDPGFSENIRLLEAEQSQFRELGARIMSSAGGDVYTVDLFLLCGIKKALSITKGFLDQIKQDNYVCAAALVRLHLDTPLRLYALTLVDNRNIFLDSVFAGIPVRRLKDREGNLMTDQYLHSKLNENYPWVTSVYQHTSGFVHLSEKHLSTLLIKKDTTNRTMTILLSETDPNIDERNKTEAVLAMLGINKLIFKICEPWIDFKNKDLHT